eukprot:gene13670-11529_t
MFPGVCTVEQEEGELVTADVELAVAREGRRIGEQAETNPRGFEEAKQKIREGQACLESWKHNYMKTRREIEQTERDQRWEFDKKRLFHTTDYMAA